MKLKPDWKPGMKPEWNTAPEWAQYLTQDRDGTWTWWENKPEYDDGDWDVKSGRVKILPVTENKFLTWTVADNSLEERPE